ncbi:MAG: hypothetical protein GY841_21845 [FCB group bacterium]|nr:hypothetical protein [FCB group bacterium]
MKTDRTDMFFFSVSRRTEIILFILIFALAVFLRMYLLSADSPNGISFSQGIETDPPQYTTHARNAELSGNWNPYNDNRHITYQYSIVSGLSRIIYGLFGVSFYTANLTAVILSLLSLLFLYFILRRSLGSGVALLALFFIGINYLGIFFGRKPFLENGMTFFFILGLFILTYAEDKAWGHLMFGAALAAAVVLGKIIGLAFLAIPAAYYLMRFFYLRDGRAIIFAAFCAVGFAAVGGVWYKLLYLPNAASITGYVGEQALGLYGTPEGFKSLPRFVWKFMIFGWDSDFFSRLPGIAMAAVVALVLLAGRLFDDKSGPPRPRYANLILICIAAWLIGTYLAQMPWNYQPVRYQTTMIYPLGVLAAITCIYLYRLKDKFNPLNGSFRFNVSMLILVVIPIYQLTATVTNHFGHELIFKKHALYVFTVVVLLASAYFVLSMKRRKIEFTFLPMARYSLAGVIILTTIVYQGKAYLDWAETPLFTTRQASRDLGRVLSPAAVVSGPFAPALTLENDLGCVIHIFGTSRTDSTLFQRLPITHLLLEKSNEKVARELYPEVMGKARIICHYYINCRKVGLYRIAYNTGNREAEQYFHSNFEGAIRAYQLAMPDTGRAYLDRFQSMNPQNQSGYTQDGFMALKDGDNQRAIGLFRRAVEFSPTDFNLHYLLGKAYIALADSTGDESARKLGEQEADLATRYNLGYYDFDDHIMEDLFKDDTDG